MKLNYFQTGSGPSLIIIHGLFGSASNFRTLAKDFAKTHTVYCLDLRNHGASPHDNDISYDAMASDVIEFMDDHRIDCSAVMGHSLGGKVAMQIALNYPERLSKLVVGDIAPVVYPHHHDRIFEGLNAVDLDKITSRKDAEETLAHYVDIPAVRLFLLTNLIRDQNKSFVWRINLKALQDGYAHVAKQPSGTPFQGPTLFIRGSLSDYVKEEYFPALYELFPHAEITTLEGVGHWLHAEKPKEYSEIVLNFLNRD